jgi:hypothetical protein
MDKIGHIILAVIFMLIGYLTGYLEIGVAITIAFFYGREEAQQERRYIYDKTRGGDPSRKWRAPLFIDWQIDALLDFFLPTIVAIIMYISL